MSMPKINLVVVGHKDHGKSTLIGRILYDSNAISEQKLQEVEAELKKAGDEGFRFAFLLDTLEEERRGGLTIDIVHTPFKTPKYVYTIIDCPGHKEFIKKMFTGASQADAAVLVVSAKEGIQNQTRQHAFSIKTLGIQQLIVAVNKMDESNYAEATYNRICDLLHPILVSLGYESAPIVPISALKGENIVNKSSKMPWYDGSSLLETLDHTIQPSTPQIDKPLRGSVQDVYEVDGKTIVICKILRGILKEGQKVYFTPSGNEGLVTKIEMFGRDVATARPGDSVGLIVNELHTVKRGDVLSDPQNRPKAVKRFVAELILFSEEVTQNDVLAIRCGTADESCKVDTILEKIDPINLTVADTLPETLKEGDVGKLLLSPLVAMCVETYAECAELGRFVVEGKRGATAAGIVLETRS